MPQNFPPWSNVFLRVLLVCAVLIVLALPWIIYGFNLSHWTTGVGRPQPQPASFSHKMHVEGLGMDCRYCHTSVESCPFAGMPTTKSCMNCHLLMGQTAAALQPVRDSFSKDKPLGWARVNAMPDFVIFDHSIHVKKGFACAACHGDVGRAASTVKMSSLRMSWCLGCHRNPEQFVSPPGSLFGALEVSSPQERKKLVHTYGIGRAENCSLCHT